MRVGCKSGRRNPVGVGYVGVEVLGGWDWVRREGRLIWAKISKTEPRGLNLQASLYIFYIVYSILLPVLLQKQHVIAVT